MASNKKNREKKPPRPAGCCVFCGKTGLTKEHIWSDWLSDIIPNAASHTQTILGSRGLTSGEMVYSPALAKVRQGSTIQRKLRNVCRGCNCGWMSETVERAKSSAKPMILGQAAKLERSDQTAFATWIAITTIMAEFLDTEGGVIPFADRKTIRAMRAPPETWTISVGWYSGTQRYPIDHRHASRGFSSEPSPHPTDTMQLTTSVLGSLFVQVFSSSSIDLVNSYRGFPAHRGLSQLWPIVEDVVNWPIGVAFGDEEYDRFAFAFLRAMSQDHVS